MTTTTTRLIHLLLDRSTDVACGEDAINVTTNPAAVTCPRCLVDEVALATTRSGSSYGTDAVPDLVVVKPAEEAAEPLSGLRSPDGVRLWRNERHLSIRKLAKLMGVHWMTIYRWEAGVTPIPRTTELALKGLERERSELQNST